MTRWTLALTLPALLLVAPPASGQAWVNPSKEGTIGVFYQFITSSIHLDKEGNPNPNLGREALHIVVLDADYGLTDRLTLGGSVAALATIWEGHERDAHGPVDTGTYHATTQDARVELRYQLASAVLAVAPFVAYGTPTRAYETRGHSAFGRRLRELQVGASVGREFTLPRPGHVAGSVAYAFSEHVEGVDLDLDRITGDVEVGFGLTPRLGVRGFGTWQYMRDGLEFPLPPDHPLRPVHDRFARASYLQIGGSATIALGRRFDLLVLGFGTAYGQNMHALRAVMTGVSWHFGGGFKIADPAPNAASHPAHD